MSKYIVHEFEAQELAGAILGIKEEDYDNDIDENEWEIGVENALEEEYDITLENYTKIVNDLMQKLTVACSPITDKVYIGFSEPGMWLVKKECDEWIMNVLQWLGGRDDMEVGKGSMRTITAHDKPEWEITLKKL